MAYSRPIVLSMAGLDPSGGAGLLADMKTVEQHRCIGMGVATAWTVQTESRFESVHWLSLQEILSQLQPLLSQYRIGAVKIGIVPNLEILRTLLQVLPNVPVVWDPVLVASAGGSFLQEITDHLLEEVLHRVMLVTPNVPESNVLQLPRTGCTTYLKGGHDRTHKGRDVLYRGISLMHEFPSSGELPAKHGSGCVLSSAIAAGLAKGEGLVTACTNAKAYTEKILASNNQRLAYHYV
ncbi:hydroxymethylpyrimidine/phosphomethylpyrimidine kinase [Chitinophaga parva]|uniref:hydroxymethylpyrimidine kinase n=1 Tax=Chitinophaga parva TaxID=2169414 RepID=A0A2T7BH79_9BACT|nr:hydroxymethylpyrimidine/phosphomethylpyrimidine kinase [Chitinophaga parva]PUZ25603.1 hydroxymethylpyrimidine/phosphomethylpyrimidine kinase [Chitinophaga parva]